MPLLIALAENLAAAGVTVLRCDLPFRQQRPSGPPRGSGTEDQAGLKRALEIMKPRAQRRIFLGGQSYGGRQASMLLSEEPVVADGLLLLSYPLHPPGKPAQLRTKHLPGLRVPCLFVSGTKDPFGMPEEIAAALKLIPTQTSLLAIERAGHDLGYGRRPSKAMQDLPHRIAREFLAFFSK
jgi:predicted alpha/beta-hydrolase family hydrolase